MLSNLEVIEFKEFSDCKLDSASGLVQFWQSSEFFSSNYFQTEQHVVLLPILSVRLLTNQHPVIL